MFPIRLAFALGQVVIASTLFSQEQVPPQPLPGAFEAYFTTSSEMIFSVPQLDVNGSDRGAVVRFSPFLNMTGMLNYDLGGHFGLFAGLSFRNQGFIYQVPDTSVRYKFRTYNAGLPVGFKFGKMNNTLVYVGYELELPFNYKEKRFENERKEEKFNVWISDRTAPFFQSVFVGFQGPNGSTITARYYLTNFHNTDFVETINGVNSKPYAGLNAHIFAISFGYGLFDARATERSGEQRKPMDVETRAMRR
jgi:hypothetical protein